MRMSLGAALVEGKKFGISSLNKTRISGTVFSVDGLGSSPVIFLKYSLNFKLKLNSMRLLISQIREQCSVCAGTPPNTKSIPFQGLSTAP